MSKAESTPKTAAETLDGVIAFVKRSFMFWKRSTLVFLLVALAAIPGVFLKGRIYRSETVVLYQENIKAEALTGGETDTARRVGARLREMLLSRASLEPIVRDIPRYNALADRRGMVDAVDELRGHIGFKAREGDAFEISYDAPVPDEAKDVTERLGQRIVEEAASQRNEQSKATKEYLEAQSKQNKTKLDDANGALSSFLTKNPEFIRLTLPGGGVGVPGMPTVGIGAIPTAPPGTKDPVGFQMEAEIRRLEKQLKAGRADGTVPTAPAREESDELKAARRDLAEKRAQFIDQHPNVLAAQRRLQTAIDNDAKRAPAPTPPPHAGKMSDADRAELEQRIASLRRSVADRRKAPTPTPTPPPSAGATATTPVPAPSAASVVLEVEFRRLQRESEYLKDAQKQLDDKLFKAGLTAGASTNVGNIQVKILDPAYLPVHPISKPRSTMLAMYLAAASILAILLALVSARLDDRIYQKVDLEILDILPVVGVVPQGRQRRRA